MKTLITVVVALFMLGGCSTFHQVSHLEQQNESLLRQVKSANIKVDTLNSGNLYLKSELEDIKDQLQTIIEMQGEKG